MKTCSSWLAYGSYTLLSEACGRRSGQKAGGVEKHKNNNIPGGWACNGAGVEKDTNEEDRDLGQYL